MRVHVCVYVCAYMRVYVHVHMYVYAYMCFCVNVCIYMYMHTHVGVHMHSCRRILFWAFVLSNPSTTCVCITGVFSTPACVCGGVLEVGFFPACSWLVLVACVGGYVLAGVETGVLSCIFFYFCGC